MGNNNQQQHPTITKTIVTTTSASPTSDRLNYKILTQQLPQQSATGAQTLTVSNSAASSSSGGGQHHPPMLTTVVRPSSNQLAAIKSVNAGSILNVLNKPATVVVNNPMVITKTVSDSNESGGAATAVKRQLITMRNDTNGTNNAARSLLGLSNSGGGASMSPSASAVSKVSLTPIATHNSSTVTSHQFYSASLPDQFSETFNSSAASSSKPTHPNRTVAAGNSSNGSSAYFTQSQPSVSLSSNSTSSSSGLVSSSLNSNAGGVAATASGANSARKPCNCTKSMCLKL
jgi:hypothetical protein